MSMKCRAFVAAALRNEPNRRANSKLRIYREPARVGVVYCLWVNYAKYVMALKPHTNRKNVEVGMFSYDLRLKVFR